VRRSFCIVLVFLFLGGVDTFASVETRRTPVVVAVEKAIPAVVDIRTRKRIRVSRSPFGLFRSPFDDLLFPRGLFEEDVVSSSLGSGVIVDDQGHIVTNNHVVTFAIGRREDEADVIEVLLHNEDIPRKADIVGREPSEDVAILKIAGGAPKRFLPFGRSSDLMIGETVIAIGYALGQSHTVTQGIISQLGRFIEDETGRVLTNLIQADADINPGNSGGPLINIDGELIGLNTAIASPSGGSVGIGFAIPVNRVKKIYEFYVHGTPSIEQRLGIEVQNLYPRLRAALRENIEGLREVEDLHGVLVTQVRSGSAGDGLIQRFDVIQSVDGMRIDASDDITSDLVPEGESGVQLEILRGGEPIVVTVPLGSFEKRDKQVEDRSNVWLGMELRPLDDEWRQRWNVRRDLQGLVVTRVKKNSPAQIAELKPGDIICQIGPAGSSDSGLPVTSLQDLNEVRRGLSNQRSLAVYFCRYESRRGTWSYWRTEIDRESV